MENFHVDLAEVVAVVTEASLLAIVYYPDSKKLGIWSRADGYQAMLPRRADARLPGRGELAARRTRAARQPRARGLSSDVDVR